MTKNYIETIIGLIVLSVAIGFGYYSYTTSGMNKNELTGYTLNANFDRIDGLNVGSDVKVSGIKVGTVYFSDLDRYTYQAKLKLNIDTSVKLPDDSSAEVVSSGLLGDKYIAIVPGGSETYFKEGDKIKFTQSSISLESLIGKFMFGSSDEKKQEKKTDSSF
jgi:phospholipid/cholesterol/gamma-HCH transport system substrate-binding protein